ncbi:MAG: HAD family phosphatase [Phycisphaerae bacterium]|nr:HAD family phosphatase [Phycisphaerae bacterium]
MPTIKGIIFDWGGVLIDDPAPSLIAFCSSALDVSPNVFEKAYSLFSAEFQKGSISESQFWEKVCSSLNIPPPKSQSLWLEAFRESDSPKKDVFALAGSLRANGYKTAILSNTEIPAVEYFNEKEYGYFDVAVFSCSQGTMKPERRIYELTLEKLNLQPKEAVFIDDKPEYVEGANKVGLNTILFRNIEQVKNRLRTYSVRIDT